VIAVQFLKLLLCQAISTFLGFVNVLPEFFEIIQILDPLLNKALVELWPALV
jgi:hypothetical protein